ncbi:hypothetical protein UFOVP594_19 [uncultured Caudovirales phage]|uniref:Major tail protein n=1 Tax=uncultured Caudovirales phage TaxID=2100421 RepID=A0A6J5MZT8_9CAUD|nr:hypothetical protein UFOVP594_19 [uncultured Caudovirales phage]
MSKFIGRLADIGVAIETTRGTAESTATFWLPKMSMSYDDKIDQVIDESSIGVIEDSTGASIIAKYGEGEFEGKIGDKSIGVLLKSILGTVSTTTGGQTSTYSHTITVQQDAQHDSITIFQDDPNQDYKYGLGMINTMDIDVALGEFCKVTCSFRSKAGATATLTPSYTAENNFLPQHGVIKYATTQAGLSAGTSVALKSVKLSFNSNVEDDRKIGSLDPVDILNKQFSAEGSVEMVFDTELFKTQLLADTAQALRVELTNTDVTIGTSLNPKLTIDFYKVKWGEFTRNYANNDVVSVTASFKAFYSMTDSAMMQIVLLNAQATY